MKNVLVFSDEYPPAGGGAGAVAQQLVRDLAHRGLRVTVVSGDEGDAPESNVKQHIRVFRYTLIWPLSYFFALRRLDLTKFDFILLNDLTAVYIAGLLFSKDALTRAIIIIHGPDSQFVYRQRDLKQFVFRYPRVYSRVVRNCRHLVAVSRYSKHRYTRFVPFTIDGRRISHCYPGLPSKELGKPHEISRKDLGLSQGSTLFFTASRLAHNKGLLGQLDLFVESIRDGCDYYWLIAGSGPIESDIRDRVGRYGLGDRVRLLGKLPREELASYYSVADVFWLLSGAESLGLVYLEAAYFGTPCIALRKPGIDEAVREGTTGFFFDGGKLKSVAERCLQEIDKAECMKFARSFSSAVFAERLLTLGAQ